MRFIISCITCSLASCWAFIMIACRCSGVSWLSCAPRSDIIFVFDKQGLFPLSYKDREVIDVTGGSCSSGWCLDDRNPHTFNNNENQCCSR
jgi:hypothetical protein